MLDGLVFPESAIERNRWVLRQRPPRNSVTAARAYASFIEEECGADWQPERVAAVFLTNRECPFRCTMCDLWRNTLTESVPAGAIPEQIEIALSKLAPARTIKLYNSGSFFDPHAIPSEDFENIAAHLRAFERVIVECHPAFVGDRCVAFRDLLDGKLEVAMGLETVNPGVLDKLNKRMTLKQFGDAASFLRNHAIDLRVFVLVQPPFMEPEESLRWAQRSLDFAFDCGATAASLIPTRAGNGAMEALAEAGMFVAPRLRKLEDATAYGLGLRRGRVFADLWDLKRGQECEQCFEARVQRLREMNLRQVAMPEVRCGSCGGASREAD